MKEGQPFIKINEFTENTSTSMKLFVLEVSVKIFLTRATFCGLGVKDSNLKFQRLK